jgi:hypothetical protein
MFTDGARWLGLLAVCFAFATRPACASPLTYEFSGTLNQPYNGSTQFSGTFTYNTSLPPYPGIQPSPGWAYYSGVPTDPSSSAVSLNFAIGNLSSSSLGNVASDEVIVTHSTASDAFYISEAFHSGGTQNLAAEFGIINNNLLQRGPFNSLSPPSSLNVANFSMGAGFSLVGTMANGQWVNIDGTITSLEPINFTAAPEPASFVVFAMLGLGYLGSRRVSAIRRKR